MRRSIMTSFPGLGLLCLAVPAIAQPVVQDAYLKASNTGGTDGFGYAVAISGDTLVIGAPMEDSDARGVDGDQSNNNAQDSGAVYVFVRTGAGWVQQAYLKASNSERNDLFGGAVAISGDTIVVGARYEDSAARGVNGDQASNAVSGAGAAYVFVRERAAWSQQAYLKASNSELQDLFGASVAIAGDTIVVGAFWEDSAATGVDGSQDDNSAQDSGAAYVFVRNGTTWSQQAYLKASNTDAGDAFGWCVSAGADAGDPLVLVTAVGEDSNATGVDGGQTDDSAENSGAAYVFSRAGTSWSQRAYVKASNTQSEDQFGWAGAAGDGAVVVGAPVESSAATGVDGDQQNNGAGGSGAAYVFERSESGWVQRAYLKASNTGAGDAFGTSVTISGGGVLIAAPFEDSSATGVDGDQGNAGAADSGAVYFFGRDASAWSHHAYIKASNTGAGDLFGGNQLTSSAGIALSGGWAVIGAWLEDSNATGVNGNQANNTANGAGAAYVFSGLGASCRADFDGNGQLDFFDYLDFVTAFDAEDPAADFDGNGQVDFFDYLDFSQAFDAGCE